jgi:hypothetical protein
VAAVDEFATFGFEDGIEADEVVVGIGEKARPIMHVQEHHAGSHKRFDVAPILARGQELAQGFHQLRLRAGPFEKRFCGGFHYVSFHRSQIHK